MDKKVIYLGLMIIALVMMIVCLFMPQGEMKVVMKVIIAAACLAVATMGTIMKERWSIIWWFNAIIWLI